MGVSFTKSDSSDSQFPGGLEGDGGREKGEEEGMGRWMSGYIDGWMDTHTHIHIHAVHTGMELPALEGRELTCFS